MLVGMDGQNSCDVSGPGVCRTDTAFTRKTQIHDAKQAPRCSFGPRYDPDRRSCRFPPVMPALGRR
jgi:hypothetical protein